MNKNSNAFKAIGTVSIMLGSLALIALLLTLIAVATGLSYYGTLAVSGFDTMGSMIGLLALGIIVAIYSFILVGIGVSYLKFGNLTDAHCIRNKGSILSCSIMLTIWIPLIGAVVFFPYNAIGDYKVNTAERESQLAVDSDWQQDSAAQSSQDINQQTNQHSTPSSTNSVETANNNVANSQASQPVAQCNLGSYDREDVTLTPTQQRYFDNELAKYRKPKSIERHLKFLRDVRERGVLTDQEYNDARDKAIEGQIKQAVKTKVS